MAKENQEIVNGWVVWGKHVLEELIELKEQNKELDRNVNKIHTEIAVLKVKSGIWGLLGGLIPVTITLVIIFITGLL